MKSEGDIEKVYVKITSVDGRWMIDTIVRENREISQMKKKVTRELSLKWLYRMVEESKIVLAPNCQISFHACEGGYVKRGRENETRGETEKGKQTCEDKKQ